MLPEQIVSLHGDSPESVSTTLASLSRLQPPCKLWVFLVWVSSNPSLSVIVRRVRETEPIVGNGPLM
jgi:hypothetical protein